ncbi:MAG: 50S ribosome-binding GTPase [Candidatus Heimdallarchaeota archaeon]|nr:50S ribosome-binding GTPase [Candidatus Heimdallarchaeota archaeon]
MPKPYSVMMDEINSRLQGKVGDERAKEIRQLLKEIQFDVGDYRKIKDKLKRDLKEIETIEQAKKASRKGGQTKKETPQFVVIGAANSGKSTLINNLTGTNFLVADYPYTTTEPQYGALKYDKVNFQLVELPAIYEGCWDSDKSTLAIVHSTDCLLILGRSIKDFNLVLSELKRNNIHLRAERMDEGFAQLTPRTLPAFLVYDENLEVIPSTGLKMISNENLETIKKAMVEITRPKRIYTMDSFNKIEELPVVFFKDQLTVKDVVKKIGKGKVEIFKDAVILEGGPTGRKKRVGISYELSDNDVVHLTFHK